MDLHVLEFKGDRVGPEKLVADHAREMEAERVFKRKGAVIDTLDVFFLYVAQGNLMHGVRYDPQRPAAAGTLSSSVFLQLDAGFFYHRLREFNTRTH